MYTYVINPKTHNLEFTLTEDGKRYLQECQLENPDGFMSDDFMYEFFKDLVCNDEYEFSRPEYIGTLTDAPILAIYDEERKIPSPQDHPAAHDDEFHLWNRVTSNDEYTPVWRAWAYMNYQVDTPQEELLRTGSCTWECGYWNDDEENDEN